MYTRSEPGSVVLPTYNRQQTNMHTHAHMTCTLTHSNNGDDDDHDDDDDDDAAAADDDDDVDDDGAAHRHTLRHHHQRRPSNLAFLAVHLVYVLWDFHILCLIRSPPLQRVAEQRRGSLVPKHWFP